MAVPGRFALWALATLGTFSGAAATAEDHLADVRQPAVGGENAEASWSPDGSRLAVGSNRFPGETREATVAVARRLETPPHIEPGSAERYLSSVSWLADDARQGRGVGTQGLAEAGRWLEARFRELGLEPGVEDGFRHGFEVPVGVSAVETTRLEIDGQPLELGTDFVVTGFSASETASGVIVPVGYGIQDAELGRDDYDGVDVEGKLALVRRFVPELAPFKEPANARRLGDLRYKAFTARRHGAVGLLVADVPETGEAEEAPLPELRVEGRGDAGIPVVVLSRDTGKKLFEGAHQATVAVELAYQHETAFNVVGRLPADPDNRLPGAVILGAHYDHLGFGGRGSLDPESHQVHNGADDNASGVAALLETAHQLTRRSEPLRRDVWFVAFSAEEMGLIGSTAFTRHPPEPLALDQAYTMINFDMVGRLRESRLAVLGGGSAAEWEEILDPLCDEVGIVCSAGGDGYGPSDQTSFYALGIPVLHFFSGVHQDYHKPTDDVEKINATGGAQVAMLATRLTEELAVRSDHLTYKRVASPPPTDGDVRSHGASLGTVPDFSGAGEGVKGVLLAGVRADGPAEKAGLLRGDRLVALGGDEIGDLYDLMYALQSHKPGETVTVAVERDGVRLEMKATLGKSRRRR